MKSTGADFIEHPFGAAMPTQTGNSPLAATHSTGIKSGEGAKDLLGEHLKEHRLRAHGLVELKLTLIADLDDDGALDGIVAFGEVHGSRDSVILLDP